MKHNRLLLILAILCAIVFLSGCAPDHDPVLPTSISFDDASVNLDLGGTVTLKVKVEPTEALVNAGIKWVSADERVATVTAEGLVTGVAQGKTIITATTSNGLKAEITVYVNYRTLQGISLPVTGEVYTEKTLKLTPTMTPANANIGTELTWVSLNTDVATVDAEGNVTGKKKGTAEIKVTSENGQTATCKVSVLTPAGNLRFGEAKYTAWVNGDTLTLVPLEKNDAKLSWSSSKEDIATVDDTGKITAIKAGETTITAKVGDKTATCTVQILAPAGNLRFEKEFYATEISGKTLKLSALEANDSKLTWSSSNQDVATVDESGNITAKTVGETVITVKTGDKTTDKKATCKVKVCDIIVSPEKPLSSIMTDEYKAKPTFTLAGTLTEEDWDILVANCDEKNLDLSAIENNSFREQLFRGKTLGKLVLPSVLTEIKKYFVLWNANIGELVLPPTLTFLARQTFEYSTIGHLHFTSPNVYMDYNPWRCTINKLTFEEGMTKTPDLMFYAHGKNPSTIKEIVFPKSMTTISNGSFNGTILPAGFSIPATITTIGDNAFTNTNLVEIVIPASVTSLSDNAFDFSKVQKITFLGAVPPARVTRSKEDGGPLLPDAKTGWNTVTVIVPAGAEDAYKASDWFKPVEHYAPVIGENVVNFDPAKIQNLP